VNCQQKSLRQAQPLDDAQPDGLAHQVGLAELNPLRLGDLTIAELAEHLGVLRLVDHGNTITQNEIMSTLQRVFLEKSFRGLWSRLARNLLGGELARFLLLGGDLCKCLIVNDLRRAPPTPT